MEEGRFVYMNYVGKVKGTNEVFDTNIEEIAKKSGIFDEKRKYKPLPVIIGARFLLPALEEEMKNMKEGEKKLVELPPEKAFGLRDERLKRYFSVKELEARKIEPKVGESISINGITGKILSISGGRVLVDFNHPLAGKTLEFEIEVLKDIKDLLEKIEAIVEIFTGQKENFEIKIKDSEITIVDKNNALMPEGRRVISENIFKWIKEVKKVNFLISFSRN